MPEQYLCSVCGESSRYATCERCVAEMAQRPPAQSNYEKAREAIEAEVTLENPNTRAVAIANQAYISALLAIADAVNALRDAPISGVGLTLLRQAGLAEMYDLAETVEVPGWGKPTIPVEKK